MKSKLKQSATRDNVLKEFKHLVFRQFHPDRTVDKSLFDQVEAEQIFQLLTRKKDKFKNSAAAHGVQPNNADHNKRHHPSRNQLGIHRIPIILSKDVMVPHSHHFHPNNLG